MDMFWQVINFLANSDVAIFSRLALVIAGVLIYSWTVLKQVVELGYYWNRDDGFNRLRVIIASLVTINTLSGVPVAVYFGLRWSGVAAIEMPELQDLIVVLGGVTYFVSSVMTALIYVYQRKLPEVSK